MRIYKSFFRFEKCRKACKYRLYRLMRTYKEIVKNYILIYCKIQHSFVRKQIHIYYCMKIAEIIFQTRSSFSVLRLDVFLQ